MTPGADAAAGGERGTAGAAQHPLIVVLGPTGVGKSALAMGLAAELGGALINADAMQVYRGCDRGTAKPDAADRARIPHFLVDVADPVSPFSAGDFVRQADIALSRLCAQGMRPILVGGTGLYIRSFLCGLMEGPARAPELRERLQRRGRERGGAYLWRMLQRLDPARAEHLPDADMQRLVRALEVRFGAGEPMSAILARDGGGIWQRPERYDSVKIGLDMERSLLLRRLEERVHRFFDAGLVEEVRGLLAGGVPASANALKGIGYRESLGVVQGELKEDEARQLTVFATRRYAKRQMTWFRREPGVHWMDGAADAESLKTAALNQIAAAG